MIALLWFACVCCSYGSLPTKWDWTDDARKDFVCRGKGKIQEMGGKKYLTAEDGYDFAGIFFNLTDSGLKLSCQGMSLPDKTNASIGAIIFRLENKNWKQLKNIGWQYALPFKTEKTLVFTVRRDELESTPGRYMIILYRNSGKPALSEIKLEKSQQGEQVYDTNSKSVDGKDVPRNENKGKREAMPISKFSDDQVIVISSQSDDAIKRAANELQYYIGMITGSAPQIITADNIDKFPNKKHINIGMNPNLKTIPDLKKCGKDGAYIIIDPQENILIAGETSQGTEFGVYTFLQDYCGVRWYLPGDNGTYIPKQKRLALPEKLNVLSAPRFISRMFSAPTFWNLKSCGETEREMDMQWLRHNRLASNISITHSFYKILPPKKYFATHPEYFPMKDGKRFAPMEHDAQGWQPCMSNQDLVKLCRDAAVEYFDKNPDEIVFSLGPNDGNGYCSCEKCQEINGKPFINNQGFESKARQLFSFLNKVAESMPEKYKDKYLGTLAYHWTRDPGDFKIHPQVALIFCTNIDGNFNKENHQDLELIKKLASNSKLVTIWGYLYGVSYAIPAFWPEIIEDYIDFINPLNVKSWYSETYQAWGRDGFKYYILAQKLWNPAVRSNKLIEEFCANMFAEGGPEIKKFFEICADRWNRQTGIPGPYTSVAGGAQFVVFPPEICAELIGLLEKAKQKCSNPKGKFLCDKFIMSISVTDNMSRLMEYELQIANAGITQNPDIELLFKTIKQLKMVQESNSLQDKDDFTRTRGGGVRSLPRGGISFEVENIASPILDSLYQFKLEGLEKQFFRRLKADYPEYEPILQSAYNARRSLQNEPELIKNSDFNLLTPDKKNAIGWKTGTWATATPVSEVLINSGKGKDGGNAYSFEGIKNGLQAAPRPCLSAEQNIPVEGSARYMLSIRGRFESSGDKYLIPWVYLEFYDKNNSKISKTDKSWGFVPAPNWITSSWIIEVPPNACFMKPTVLGTECVGKAWIDNISLKRMKSLLNVIKAQEKAQELVDCKNPAEWKGMVKLNNQIKHSGDSCFELYGKYATEITCKQMIPIDLGKTYRLSVWLRTLDEQLPASANFGLRMYDKDKNPININNVTVYPNTETTLAADAVKGEKELFVVKNVEWLKAKNSAIAFNSETNYRDLPNFAVSRVDKIVDEGERYKVTLQGALGKAYPAGTKVRQHSPWGAPLYWVADNWMPTTWKQFSTILRGESQSGTPSDKFWKGTKYVRVFVWFGNWNRIPEEGARLLVDDIKFTCDEPISKL